MWKKPDRAVNLVAIEGQLSVIREAVEEEETVVGVPRKVWALDFQLSIRLFPQRAEVQQGQVAAKLRDPREEVDRPEGAPEEGDQEANQNPIVATRHWD